MRRHTPANVIKGEESMAANASEYVVHGSIGMTRGSLLRIDEGRDILVYVWEGEVWLTQDRDSADRVMKAGDWFRLDRNGAAIAYAFERSVLTLTAPEPEYYAERIQLTPAGTSTPRLLYSADRMRAATVAAFLARLRRRWANLFVPHARPTSASL